MINRLFSALVVSIGTIFAIVIFNEWLAHTEPENTPIDQSHDDVVEQEERFLKDKPLPGTTTWPAR
jgi:hypothetical protein